MSSTPDAAPACLAVGVTTRPARVDDVHDAASAMPHVKVEHGKQQGNAVYQVGGKSFVFFRTARPDACDPATASPTTT